MEPGTQQAVAGQTRLRGWPHGAFSLDLHQAPGYMFIAGEVGITPFFSMLGTMCVRDDVRPVTLLYASRDWHHVIFREQLEELKLYMPHLRVVHIVKDPPPDWVGETGHITARLLNKYLPPRPHHFEYFICGPEGLMDASEQALAELGVREERIHSERFQVV